MGEWTRLAEKLTKTGLCRWLCLTRPHTHDMAEPVNIQRATHDNAELDVTHGIPGSYYINSHVQPVSPPRGESTNGVDSRAQALETSLAAISPPRSSRKTEAQLKMLEEASEPLAPKQRRFQDAPFNKLPTVARR